MLAVKQAEIEELNMRKCMGNPNILQARELSPYIDGEFVVIGNFVLMQDE